MRRMLVLFVSVLTFSAVAPAALLCTANPSLPVVVTSGPVSAFECSMGGLTFSNFSAQAATATTPPTQTIVNLTRAWIVDSDVFLMFNPGLSSNQDLYFYFTVSGPLAGVDLSLSGANAFSTEIICSGEIALNNNCVGGSEYQLARMANVAGADPVTSSFAQTTGGSIYKDIMVQSGGELSSITQSFHVVPEPVTFLLIGTGLVGLSLLRRKARKS